MAEVIIENIIAYTHIADKLNIEEIAEKLPEFKFNPDEFSGLTLKLENPNAAVLLLPEGKAICTGAKKIEDAENAVKRTIEKLKGIEKRISKIPGESNTSTVRIKETKSKSASIPDTDIPVVA